MARQMQSNREHESVWSLPHPVVLLTSVSTDEYRVRERRRFLRADKDLRLSCKSTDERIGLSGVRAAPALLARAHALFAALTCSCLRMRTVFHVSTRARVLKSGEIFDPDASYVLESLSPASTVLNVYLFVFVCTL